MAPASLRLVLTVGLTGGIACGKSTVDAMFGELGAHVIDADAIVHGLLASGGAAVAPVTSAFGSSVAAADGGIDRAALGAIVFADAGARARLEKIVHPLVGEEIAARIGSLRRSPGGPIVIVDAALLVETGIDRHFDRLIVVACREQTQLQRLVTERGMAKEEALTRIRTQASAEEKAARAHYRIDNDGSFEETRAQVERVYRSLLEDFEKERAAGRLERVRAWT
jgi:dephospho-CoA kinase